MRPVQRWEPQFEKWLQIDIGGLSVRLDDIVAVVNLEEAASTDLSAAPGGPFKELTPCPRSLVVTPGQVWPSPLASRTIAQRMNEIIPRK
jgi:hypothetical protein